MKIPRIEQWKNEILKHKYLILLSILAFILANYLQVLASRYADKVSSNTVTDLILDNIPTIDLSLVFAYGLIIITAVFFLYPFFFRINNFHITISQFSLLLLIRSFFLTLTHLRISLDVIMARMPDFYKYFLYQNDLFFSGHVAIPFLGYLLFRKNKVGIFFLISSIIMAITVLFMHIHYSIDVFAAFFIAYGSYKIGNFILEKSGNMVF